MSRKPARPSDDLDQLPFEQAIARLESLVDEVEGGAIDLEQVLDRYAQGTALIRRCQTVLDAAERKITELTLDAKGRLQPGAEADAPDA